MAGRWWMATLAAGLSAGLLPGCLTAPGTRISAGDSRDVKGQAEPAAVPFLRPVVQPPQAQGRLEISAPPDSDYHPFPDRYLLPGAGARQLPSMKEGDPSEEQSVDKAVDVPPPVPGTPRPSQPVVVYQTPTAPVPEKKEPLLEALDCFLRKQPDRALEMLKSYQASSQEVYIALLPVLAQLTHKGLDQLSPEEASAIHEQLSSLSLSLRPRSRLAIDRMCFCERIKGYGLYKPLPAGHVFRPRNGDRPGEAVQLYVELRNFSLEPCARGYLTRLASAVEIRDATGKKQWFHSFKDQEDREGPLYRQTPWSDCFGNYRFYVPYLPPGSYTLTIVIRDLSRPDEPREAKKSLPMRISL